MYICSAQNYKLANSNVRTDMKGKGRKNIRLQIEDSIKESLKKVEAKSKYIEVVILMNT